ncbi:hypothetical protein NW752_007332 [Fusarium irregulare]|uniref:Uncharacterized protein n=1 Tax=Fusarium irregulare TaxID=2494466 RepID=A0A9W8PM34_9HYPO|nr:hypothetical protein NW766_007769 [Fusarium irregulare]KAJ4014564.1 hypothetical protein NW752_007332 [Fusarium irregulare]
MPKVAAPNTWVGAPPATQDNFAFADGVFFAQASGQNRHRRATATELKEHFTSGNDKDHPAHWFEAQLIHYGLPPSKTKSVARMRLFDAVNAGGLKVPDAVGKIESKLKKEWTKNDREAKKGAVKAETKATKRKADDDGTAAAKKVKTATPKTATPKASAPKATAPKTATPKAKAPAKTPAKATAKTTIKTTTKTTTTTTTTTTKAQPKAQPKAAAKAPPKATTATEQSAPKKQTAICGGRGGAAIAPGRSASTSEPARPPRTKQTARRGGAIAARGRIPVPSGDFDDSPPPYSEFRDHSDGNSDEDDDELAPLGLLNGDYYFVSSDVTEQWDYDLDELEFTLTLAGNELWGRFNLGVYEGVLRFDERPMRSSHDRLYFTWRGREDQGPVIYGENNKGWMEFLGNGRINGCIERQSLSFRVRRVEGQGTRSSIDARDLQDEYDGYDEDLYDQENRARW